MLKPIQVRRLAARHLVVGMQHGALGAVLAELAQLVALQPGKDALRLSMSDDAEATATGLP
jgi:hypothetical protein